MWEETPYVELFFYSTVPVPCRGCKAVMKIKKHKGLTVSDCVVTLSATDPPLTNHSVRVRAVQTPGTNARIVRLEFGRITTEGRDAALWDGREIPDIEVSRLPSRRRRGRTVNSNFLK